MGDLDAAGQFIERYGLPLFMFLASTAAYMSGKLRAEREVTREKEATVREREISADKDVIIVALTAEIKEQTVAMNRIADGLEARNKIEKEMRGRRA